MMPMLDSMFQTRRKRAKQPVSPDRTSLSKGNPPVGMQMQGIMLIKRLQLAKQPVMLGPSIRTRGLQLPVLVLMPTRGIMCQRKVN